jgi:RNA polymerase sigma-70 factor (ECF subfamily)
LELQSALGELPAIQRETLFMVVLQGLPYEEVSELTGCAVGTAKSRAFRARRCLEARLLGDEARNVGDGPNPDPRAGAGTSCEGV